MSRNYPPPSAAGNIGNALGSFAQGYMNAKSKKREQEDMERSKLHEHAQLLLQTALDPTFAGNESIQRALHTAAFDAYDKADAGPEKKGKKQEGIGGLMKRMLGMGGYDAAPAQGPGPMSTMLQNAESEWNAKHKASQPSVLPQREEGSGTWGSLDLGPAAGQGVATGQGTGMPTSDRPTLPQTPREMGKQTFDEFGRGTVPEPPVVEYAQAQQRTASPQQSAAMAAYTAHPHVSPDQLVEQNTSFWGGQNKPEIQRQANEIINDLMNHVDSFIDVTPGHETLEQAYAHPLIRQALDMVKQYAPITGQTFETIVGGRFADKAESDKPSKIGDLIDEKGQQVFTFQRPDGTTFMQTGDGKPYTGTGIQFQKPQEPSGDFEKYWLPATAAKLGKSVKDMSPQEVLEAQTAFAQKAQDPQAAGQLEALRRLQIASEQLRVDQQPSAAQAMDVANDLVRHHMAPEQMASIFGGFGVAGQNFKRMVYAEAKKLDPEFDFEQASAEYQLTKSPNFQNTIRYMDSINESIPLVISRAKTLANGNIRSINSLINTGQNQFNSVDLKKFNVDRLLVADEIAKILGGGGTGSQTSDSKLAQAQSILSENDSPEAIVGALADVQQLLGYRRNSLTKGTYYEKANANPNASNAAKTNPFR